LLTLKKSVRMEYQNSSIAVSAVSNWGLIWIVTDKIWSHDWDEPNGRVHAR